jgi:hypothetical protein
MVAAVRPARKEKDASALLARPAPGTYSQMRIMGLSRGGSTFRDTPYPAKYTERHRSPFGTVAQAPPRPRTRRRRFGTPASLSTVGELTSWCSRTQRTQSHPGSSHPRDSTDPHPDQRRPALLYFGNGALSPSAAAARRGQALGIRACTTCSRWGAPVCSNWSRPRRPSPPRTPRWWCRVRQGKRHHEA